MNKKEKAIKLIFILPYNQFRFKYKLNNGSFHTIKKEELFFFLKTFITKDKYNEVLDYISRFRPFIIKVDCNEVIELTKNLNDKDYYKDVLSKNIHSVTSKPKVINEYIPNDNLINKKINKYLKITKKSV